MMTITSLIINEMRSVLGHNPDKQEMDSLSEYLEACKINYLVDLELEIMNWKKEKTQECPWCGDRFLPSEMIQTEVGYFCCDKCKEDYETEHGKTI